MAAATKPKPSFGGGKKFPPFKGKPPKGTKKSTNDNDADDYRGKK